MKLNIVSDCMLFVKNAACIAEQRVVIFIKRVGCTSAIVKYFPSIKVTRISILQLLGKT